MKKSYVKPEIQALPTQMYENISDANCWSGFASGRDVTITYLDPVGSVTYGPKIFKFTPKLADNCDGANGVSGPSVDAIMAELDSVYNGSLEDALYNTGVGDTPAFRPEIYSALSATAKSSNSTSGYLTFNIVDKS